VIAAWLAVGKDKAIVSHESALDLLGLSDIVPNAVHLTVPRSMRGLPSMQGVTVHTSSKPKRPHDVVTRDGVVVTSATRSILDAAEAGAAPEQIEMAVAQAINRGLVIPSQLQRDSDERGRRVADLIAGAIRKAGL
jgi:predicted transcriptional regulator of viral defense system